MCMRIDAHTVTVEVAHQLVHAIAKQKSAIEHADVCVAFIDDGTVEVKFHNAITRA